MSSVVKVALGAVIVALGMVGAAALTSNLFVRVRQEQAITVKGYAEQNLVSDVGQCRCVLRTRGASLQEAALQLEVARRSVLATLERMGFPAGAWRADPMGSVRIARRDAQGKETNAIEFYDASQALWVTSTNVALIRDLPAGLAELIKGGLDLDVGAPEFTVSDLKDVKIELLGRATEDGYRRALTLAGRSGGRVGALIAAQQGVFQITGRHSTEVSDYGQYDTATIEKTAKAVVRLQYAIEARER